MQAGTWAWLPPFPVPLPPPLLPPPLPCLCCWDPVISAILLSICSRRSRMDILNWLSRAEQRRVRLCSGRRAVDVGPRQAFRTAISLTESQRSVQARLLQHGTESDASHKTCSVYSSSELSTIGTENPFLLKYWFHVPGTPFPCQIPQWKPWRDLAGKPLERINEYNLNQ